MRHAGLIGLLLLVAACSAPDAPPGDLARWLEQAQRVEILRDDWGIPHVYGQSDADTVFGVMFAQAEDDFNRVETNLLNALGRLAEAEGEPALFSDLRMRLFIDPDELQALYRDSPAWLQVLLEAWADGLNYFLHTNPDVQPRVLNRFEPWMALAFSEGSIGGDIERIDVGALAAFHGGTDGARAAPVSRDATAGEFVAAGPPAFTPLPEPGGSNGFAIAPQNSADGRPLLLINPHTSFYFRAEAKMVSTEGLHAYGAMTWGQFFIYQGFNGSAGWMHTSSSVDNIDEFLERVRVRDGAREYQVGESWQALTERMVTLRYRDGDRLNSRVFTTWRTHRGPVVREQDGRWVSVALMHKPREALMQSYLRTKAADLDAFLEVMRLHANSSNNTVFADAAGNIAYLHANFVPRRDPALNWRRPVDGSDPRAEWGEPHPIEESPNAINPPTGWVQNTNNWPYSAAGEFSPRRDDFPAYMDVGSENPRGVHALRVLTGRRDFTIDSLIDAAYSRDLPAFETLLPPLLSAYAGLPPDDPLREWLAEPLALLGAWDRRWGVDSIATTLAVAWGEWLWRAVQAEAAAAEVGVYTYLETQLPAGRLLEAFSIVLERLETDFGRWQVPWGELNRFQRLTGDIVQPFNDAEPSLPVGFTGGRWGSLASFVAAPHENSRHWYGTAGNSFVAVVAFGDRLAAKAIMAGGQSGDPASAHFTDQAEPYVAGSFRDVYFYREDLEPRVTRRYTPGAGRTGTQE